MIRTLSGLTAKPLLLIWGKGVEEPEPLADPVAVVRAIELPHSKNGEVLLLARIIDEGHCAPKMAVKRIKNAG